MLWADVSFTTEGTIAIGGLLSSLVFAIGVLYRQMMTSYDRQITRLEEDRNSWRSIAEEAVTNIEKTMNRMRQDKGKGPMAPVAPVIPESSSPPTEQQQHTADIATMRARLVAATKELGLEPRLSPT